MSIIENFVRVELYSDITAAATEIRFRDAESPWNAPADPSGRTAYAVLIDDIRLPTKFEIVAYTSARFNRLRNVTRGANGSTAQTWSAGAYIAQDIPAALAESLGIEGSAGEVLKVGADGKVTTGSIDWSELSGLLSDAGVLVIDLVGSAPAAPASGGTLYAQTDGDSVTRLKMRFPDSGGVRIKIIATDA